MKEVLLLSLATASISFTVTESRLFAPFRGLVCRVHPKLGELLSCGYCLGHWVAFALTAIYRPRLMDAWWPLDYFLTALVIAWLAGVQWILICYAWDKAGK